MAKLFPHLIIMQLGWACKGRDKQTHATKRRISKKNVTIAALLFFWPGQWTLEIFSLPYSILLDYSNFEFTTLPYPTWNWKTISIQGLLIIIIILNSSSSASSQYIHLYIPHHCHHHHHYIFPSASCCQKGSLTSCWTKHLTWLWKPSNLLRSGKISRNV